MLGDASSDSSSTVEKSIGLYSNLVCSNLYSEVKSYDTPTKVRVCDISLEATMKQPGCSPHTFQHGSSIVGGCDVCN